MSGIDDLAARNVTVRKFVSVSPEAVFRLWTDAGLLKKWWGPPGVTCTEAEIDLRVGGSYRIANQLPTGATIWIHGQYEEIDRPRLLRYSWGIGLDSPPEEVVTVRFEPKDNMSVMPRLPGSNVPLMVVEPRPTVPLPASVPAVIIVLPV